MTSSAMKWASVMKVKASTKTSGLKRNVATPSAPRAADAEVPAERVERQPPERGDDHRREPEDAEGRPEDEPEERTPDDLEDRRGGDDGEDREPSLVEQDLRRAGVGPVVGGRHRRQRRHDHRREGEGEEDGEQRPVGPHPGEES